VDGLPQLGSTRLWAFTSPTPHREHLRAGRSPGRSQPAPPGYAIAAIPRSPSSLGAIAARSLDRGRRGSWHNQHDGRQTADPEPGSLPARRQVAASPSGTSSPPAHPACSGRGPVTRNAEAVDKIRRGAVSGPDGGRQGTEVAQVTSVSRPRRPRVRHGRRRHPQWPRATHREALGSPRGREHWRTSGGGR